MALAELLARCARRSPRALAVTDGSTSLTWGEVDTMSRQVSERLGDLAAGSRIALCGDAGVRTLGYAAGILRAGGSVALLAPLELGRTQRALDLWRPDAWRSVERTTTAAAIDADVDDLVAQLRTASGPRITTGASVVFSTSGSTGDPKLVSCPDDKTVGVSRTIASVLGLDPSDCILSALPPHFDYGFNQLVLAAATGASVAYYGDFLNLARFGSGDGPEVTVLASAPSQLRLIAGLPAGRLASRSIRMLTSTGAPFPVEVTDRLLELWPNCQVRSMYGMTECKRVSISNHEQFMADHRTVGHPIPGVSVSIDDSTDEIVVSSPYIMDFEANRGDLGPRIVSIAGADALATGDTGRLLDDGQIQVTGRKGQFAKIADVRISLAECEAVATRHPDVRDAAATVHGDQLTVWCEMGGQIDDRVLRDQVREQLIRWTGVPRLAETAIRPVVALPRLPNGKIDRSALVLDLTRT